jgi:hypothetical protein
MMGFRAAPVLRASIVKWAENQPDVPTLSEATRRLVELGLKAKPRDESAKMLARGVDPTAPDSKRKVRSVAVREVKR